jgi:hypothetical protein
MKPRGKISSSQLPHSLRCAPPLPSLHHTRVPQRCRRVIKLSALNPYLDPLHLVPTQSP